MSDSFFQEQMRHHVERFRCAICNAPSRGPAYETMDGLNYAWSNWNRPADLHRCRDCGEYVCADHYSLSNGSCSVCMERRDLSGRHAAD
jgi:hypothetical protein